MPKVTLKRLARHGEGPRKFIEEQFGISPSVSGADLVITDRQSARAFSAVEVLRLHPRFELAEGNEWDQASILYSQIPEDLKQYQMPPPKEVKISRDFGFISIIEEASTILAVVPEQEVIKCLAEKVLPAIMQCYRAKYVTGVSVDTDYQQACISFSKIALLAQEHDHRNVAALLDERKPLSAVLPSSLDVLSYVECLTRLSPIMFTLPFRRMGCAWHFQCEAMYRFGSDPVNGVAQQFLTDFSPLSDAAHFLGLEGLRGMDARAVFKLLRFTVAGINRLMSYLNDPRNFTLIDHSVDFLTEVQAYVAVHLLFADLNAVNYSTYAHNRITYAMSFMDKLANLRSKLGRVEENESTLMTGLASVSQRDHLKELIGSATSTFGYQDLSKSLNEMIDVCYDRLHQQLRKQSRDDEGTEASRLERIWLQRNVRHGAFLRRNAFERLFLASDGTIASTIGTLPFLLVLGLISDQARFLSFSPTVEGTQSEVGTRA
jgi:hypothetical protein